MTRRGATPTQPWGRRPYVVAGQTFASLDALSAAIATRRRAVGPDVVFQDLLIAEVITTMSPDVIAAGQRAIRFCERSWRSLSTRVRETLRYPTVFQSYFLPLGRWQDATAYPWRAGRTPQQELKTALREFWRLYVRPAVPPGGVCALCGRPDTLEYDHIAPTFDEIARVCLDMMTAAEIATRFGYEKFHPVRTALVDFLPRAHPAVQYLIRIHRMNVFQWLCARCHRRETAARRRPGGGT